MAGTPWEPLGLTEGETPALSGSDGTFWSYSTKGRLSGQSGMGFASASPTATTASPPAARPRYFRPPHPAAAELAAPVSVVPRRYSANDTYGGMPPFLVPAAESASPVDGILA